MELNYQNILVAVDGSKEAEWAFKKAVQISKRNDAALVIAHVIDTRNFVTFESYDQEVALRSEAYAKDILERYQTEAKAAGLNNVTIVIDYGSPKIKIPKDIAKKYEIDLIICGATGLNAVERFFIGSVSEHISRYASCDILIVRTDEK
ncbi:universal stress protein [Peribacillus alkalitolerans]|uniref:universal stress protein n=1 Tax=Peribacillus alkalitolerans TaxID=1550385 RepID=UPI0013D54156|nr:universal stress protein [Peribacillus alkalitolerans]